MLVIKQLIFGIHLNQAHFLQIIAENVIIIFIMIVKLTAMVTGVALQLSIIVVFVY